MTGAEIVAQLNAMNGRDGSPTIFKATYQGYTWNARKITGEICLNRTCSGCWSECTGGWNPLRHHVESCVTIEDIQEEYLRIDRLRLVGDPEFDKIADEREANAFKIV